MSYAMYEQPSYSYAAFASNRQTRRKTTKRRTKGSKGTGTDPNLQKNPVSSSYGLPKLPFPDTCNNRTRRRAWNAYCHSSFPMQHTVLSALPECINLERNPTYVILDSGCTSAMGARYAVNRLIKAVERYAPGEIEFSFSPSNTKYFPLLTVRQLLSRRRSNCGLKPCHRATPRLNFLTKVPCLFCSVY